MDEFGHLIESSHLDSDDVDDKFLTQEPETIPYTDKSNAERSSASDTKLSPVSAQDATEEDGSENAGAHKDAQEAVQKAQGGSTSAPWLGSSVTGWLGLTAAEEPGNLAEGEKEDERKETQAEAPLSYSMTEWLWSKGQEKPDDSVKSDEEKETADSFTSTMTGWLGFGGAGKNDDLMEKGQDEERDKGIEHEPAEKFRSRRMSLDLEGSQLHEEEREEMGTLEWLGNGLSNKLGFGLTNQESEQPEATTVREAKEASQEQKEPPASWFNQGIGDILGFRTDQSDVEESPESGFKEKEDDKTLEQKTGLEDMNASQSQSTLTEQLSAETSNESKVAETPTDRDVPSETEKELGSTDPITADSNNGNILEGTSDSSKDSVLTEGAASSDSQESIFLQYKLKAKSQAVGGKSSVLNSEEEEDNASDENNKGVNMQDVEGSAEIENKDHQQPNSIELEEEEEETEEGETNTAGDADQDFHNNMSEDSAGLNSAGEEAKAEVEERAKIQNQADNTHTSVETGVSSDSHKGEGRHTERDLLQTDESAEQSQVSNGAEDSSAESHPAVSSGAAEERNDSDDDDTLTARSEEKNVDHINSQDMETHQEGRFSPAEGSSQTFGSSHSTNPSNEYMSVDASGEDRGTFYTSESTRQIEDSSGEESLTPQINQNDGDAHTLTETQKGVEDRHWFEQSVLKETGPQATIDTETEKEKVEEHGEKDEFKGEEEVTGWVRQQEGEEEKQEEVMELKGEEMLQELKGSGVKGKQEDIEVGKEEVKQEAVEEGLKGEEKLQELNRSRVEGDQEDIEVEQREEKQEAVEEITTLKTQKQEIKGEEMQGDEEEEKDAMMDTKEEEEQEEVVKLKKEEKQEAVKEIKEGGKQEGVEEFEQKQQQTDELKEEVQGEVDELKEGEQRESLKEVKETREEEMKEYEERLVKPSDHFKTEVGNIPQSSPQHQKDGDSSETQSEKSSEPVLSETAREDEKRDAENPQVDREEEREGETKDREDGRSEGQAQENVEAERRCKEEEEMLKCSNGLCPQVTVDGITLDRGGDYSVHQFDMKGDKEKEGEEQNPMANKREEDGEQEEEQRAEGAGGVEGTEEHDEKENSEFNLNENGDVADAVDKNDQLDSSEEQNIKPFDDTTLHQEDKNGDAEGSSSGISTEKQTQKILSDHKRDSEGDTGREEIRVKHDDARVNEDADVLRREIDGNTVSPEFRPEATPEISDSSSDLVVEGQADQDVPRVSQHPTAASLLSDGHRKGIPETEHGGAFGLFKNAFGYFGQTPAPDSAPDLDSNAGETSQAQGSLTPEHELHPTTDSPQADIQGDPPPFPSTPSASQSHPSSLSANTGSSLHAKTISKDYKTLLAHMSADEAAILTELFGRHKLQFLDYVLRSSDSMTDERDHDESILFDIEGLLQYHRETLMAPRERLEDAPQEDKEKTRMLFALQKLEILLAKVKETLNTGNLDISNTNHQGISVYMASKIQ